MIDLSKELIKLTKKGYAPQLIYDDHNNWGIEDASITPLGKKIKWANLDLTDVIWAKTPIEALKAYLKSIK